jgi:predicted thioredoxin/glutaredoxin
MRSWIRFDGLEMLLEGMARNKIDATESWDKLLEVFIMREKRRFASNWMLVQRILDRVFGLAGCG